MTEKSELMALTALIKAHGAPTTARKLNDLLKAKGYLEVRSRPSSSDPTKTKTFVALTDTGSAFGENVGNSYTDETSPRYYRARFPDLLAELGLSAAAPEP